MAKKKVAKKKAAKKKVRPMSKGQIFVEIAEAVDIPKKKIIEIFDTMEEIVEREINPRSTKVPGIFLIPGLAKIRTVKRPAKPRRKGRNPFTGEDMMFKAKPASIAVRIRPIKNLKDMVN